MSKFPRLHGSDKPPQYPPGSEYDERAAAPPVEPFTGPDCGINGCGREVGHIGDHRPDPGSPDPVAGLRLVRGLLEHEGWTTPEGDFCIRADRLEALLASDKPDREAGA